MSNQDKVTLLVIKGAISEMPEADRKIIETKADSIRKIIDNNNLGYLALALVGAELAAKEG